MARRAALILLLLAGGSVLFLLQRHKVTVPISPAPALYLVADAEREAERIPHDVTRVSDTEEMRIGAQMSQFTCRGLGEHPDPERVKIHEYVTQVGQSLTSNVLRTGIRYTFCVDDSPYLVNAYALPGGYVVIGRGLLSLLESADELAFILGHEISHVDERHAIERVQFQLASRKLGVEGIYQLGSPIQLLIEAGYTKEQEQEADRDGLGLAHDAGYSVKGALDAMRRLEKIDHDLRESPGSPIEEFANMPFQSLQEYFRSHPPAAERRQYLEQIIASRNWNPNATVRPYALRPIFLTEEAAALDRQGKFAKSTARYEEAIQLDATYNRAREGLALAMWRSGNAAGAEAAAEAAVLFEASVASVRILARAGSIANIEHAIQTLTLAANRKITGSSVDQFARLELDALGVARENAGITAIADYRILLSETAASPQWQATLRTEMAWWMYRAGNLKDAAAELEAARQSNPNFAAALAWKAWVDSDQGHQADAENDLGTNPAATNPEGQASEQDLMAIKAVISWRTDKKDLAKSQFQQPAANDPVWLVHNWAANTFNKSTAAVIFQLQAAETARREEEARKRKQAQHQN